MRAGGLHAFIGWPRAILTDSGGFQVMSLAARRRITEEGVEFRAPEDGTKHFLTPERAMELQSGFGVDIAMVLDVCPPFPAERREVEEACRLTLAWAERSKRAYTGPGLLFGILQGGTHEDLRRQNARPMTRRSIFPGYAIGGVAVGESKDAIRGVTALSARAAPGREAAVSHGRGHAGGPARLGARGRGSLRLRPADAQRPDGPRLHVARRDRDQARALQGGPARRSTRSARCPVCRRHSRAYLRNLFVLKDFSAPMLLSMHNVFFYLAWMRRIRAAIEAGTLADARGAARGEAARRRLNLLERGYLLVSRKGGTPVKLKVNGKAPGR